MNTYYRDYLHLDKLLNAQKPKSEETQKPVHDEMLFIIVHQVYELWFKQILHELKNIQNAMGQNRVDEPQFNVAVSRLDRIKAIQSQLTGPLEVLETMTPMDFLEFRNLLVPASGFQSTQFREIEIRLGLTASRLRKMDRKYFMGRMDEKDREYLESLKDETTLFEHIEQWLERMPFASFKDFDFWREYGQAVEKSLNVEKLIIEKNIASLDQKSLDGQLENLENTKSAFAKLMNKDLYLESYEKGEVDLSHSAILNALFILLYRSEPLLFQPFRFLTNLMDIDENFSSWRYRHSLLAHRMLGSRIGTGGSSGHKYLRRTAENNRIFNDLFNLSSYLLPNQALPNLPKDLKRELAFNFQKI